jgi:A/G-specific adenine glycosylase
MMELGATVCLPRVPRCQICPLQAMCEARRAGRERQLPAKLRKTAPVKIAMAVAVVERRGRLLLWQRAADERRLAGFWELPSPEQLPEVNTRREIGKFRHTITHHHYLVTVETGTIAPKARAAPPLQWIPIETLPGMPLSTTAAKALGLAGLVSRRG